MNPLIAFNELIDRIGYVTGERILITAQELAHWPLEAVIAMKSQHLLKRSTPAKSAVCNGCERQCVMPVHIVTRNIGDEFSAFIVCDKRSDINRVSVPVDELSQWQSDAHAVARFIAESLTLRFSGERDQQSGLLQIGIASGKKRTQMLCLRRNDGFTVVAGSNELPAADFVRFEDGHFCVDAARVQALVDMSTTGDARYTPSTARREVRKLDTEAMHEQWRKEFRGLKKKHPEKSDVWISQQIAKLEMAQERDAETIRKEMKK